MALSKRNQIIIGTTVGIGVPLIVIFLTVLLTSIHYVQYNEYALRQDRFGEVELQPTYTQGRYVFSPTYIMVKLPATYQSIDITSAIFTDLGLEFDIHIAVYYQLPADNLGEIYHKFSTSYGDRITNIVKTTVKDIATSFSVNDYVVNRDKVGEAFSSVVHQKLQQTIGVDIPTLYFRLLDITFPDSVVSSSLTSAIELQNNQIQNYQQQVAVIEAETKRLVTQIEIQTNLTTATASIEANQIIQNSVAEAESIVLSARGTGMEEVLNLLEITSATARSDFIRLVSVLDATDPKIYSGDFSILVNSS